MLQQRVPLFLDTVSPGGRHRGWTVVSSYYRQGASNPVKLVFNLFHFFSQTHSYPFYAVNILIICQSVTTHIIIIVYYIAMIGSAKYMSKSIILCVNLNTSLCVCVRRVINGLVEWIHSHHRSHFIHSFY